MSDEQVHKQAVVTADRATCYCANYRKPCSFHEGVEDGEERERARILDIVADEMQKERSGDPFLACVGAFDDLRRRIDKEGSE